MVVLGINCTFVVHFDGYMARATSHKTRGCDAQLDSLQRALERHAQRFTRGRILPLLDEVAPRGWYRHFRRLLSRVSKG